MRFAIPVPDSDAPSYAVTIRRDSETVWQREDLAPREAGAPLEVSVPAEVLSAGATLLSIEPEATRGASPGPRAGRQWPLRIRRE